MRLIKHSDYEHYVRAQERFHRKKRNRVWARMNEIKSIVSYCQKQKIAVDAILCHGVRTGWEVRAFRECFPDSSFVIGTDLFQADGVVVHDYHNVREEWLDAFDLLYSNSLDHSYDPEKAMMVWAAQLVSTGYLFIEWSKWHQHINPADCFGASLDEYVELISKVGIVEDVLKCGRGKKRCSIIVASVR